MQPAQSAKKTLIVAGSAAALFLLPLTAVGVMNFDQIRPYITADAHTARGELHYFARRG